MITIYLDFDGVLHRSDCEVSAHGHLFEWMPILETILVQHDGKVAIVLSTNWVWRYGFDFTVERLSSPLQRLVVGATFDPSRIARYTFAEMRRGQQVAADILWRRPRSWFAIDDDTIDWPDLYRENLIAVNGQFGISDYVAQERIQAKLRSP